MRRIAALAAIAIPMAAAAQTQWPVGITDKALVYLPNANADSVTGLKPGWSTSLSAKQPRYGMWQNQEHAIVQTGPGRFLVVLMEFNRAYFQLPDPVFCDAYAFLEFSAGFPESPGFPQVESGYWRGATLDGHPHVWAPHVMEHAGTFYLYYTAPYPGVGGRLSPFLATSATGAADPMAWTSYDPDPVTPGQQPLFDPPNSFGSRDYNVIKVNTSQGLRFYNYYIVDANDPDTGTRMAMVKLRISASPTEWPDAGELPDPVFKRLNIGLTHPSRYTVDYENPCVVQADDASFYLFIARHGQLPPDYETNPNFTPIPPSTEVYHSADGLHFDIANQGPNLRTASGLEMNAAELFKSGTRWFATFTGASNNPADYEFDCCPVGTASPTQHSPNLLRLVTSFDDAENNLNVVEVAFQTPSAASSAWLLY